jgi:hypothetical protein
MIGSPIWRTMGRFGAAAPVGVGGDIVNMVAFGVRLGTGGAGDMERGVDAGTGVLGGIGVFVGSAMAVEESAAVNSGPVGDRCSGRTTSFFGAGYLPYLATNFCARTCRLRSTDRQWIRSSRSKLRRVSENRKLGMRRRAGGKCRNERAPLRLPR